MVGMKQARYVVSRHINSIHHYQSILASRVPSLKLHISYTLTQASTWINVVFLTAGAVGFYPDPIVMAVTIAVQVVAGTARELQIRQRSNNYLDEINEQLFKPRGLFALVMCFDPSSARKIENRHVSLADTVAKYDKNPTHASSSIAGLSGEARLEEGKPGSTSSFSMDSVKNSLKSIRVQSGTTHGELEMPEAAALIFPEVDKAVADMGDQVIAEGKGEEEMAARIKNKFKHASEFVASYTDKRSQAEYVSVFLIASVPASS
jgi:hypothetical protein